MAAKTSAARLTRHIARHVAKQSLRLRSAMRRAPHPDAIHEARRAIKKLRATVRLVEKLLAPRDLAAAKGALRAVAGALAAAREAEAMVVALDRLGEERHQRSSAAAAIGVRRWLDGRRRSAMRAAGAAHVRHLALAETACRHLGEWHWRVDRATVRKGLRRSWRRAQRAYRRVLEGTTIPRLHEWRKRVKDVHGQCRLLAEIDGRRCAWIERWDELADLLGEARDAHLLGQLLRTRAPAALASSASSASIARCAGERRQRLQQRALRLGERVHGDFPRRLRQLATKAEQ